MKQLRWVVLIIVLTSIVLLASPTQAEELEASIEVLERGVQVMELGTKEWKPVQNDTLVSAGDRVRTDETGYALITWFDDGTFVELQPNTELIIEEFSANDESFMIDASLLKGSILNSVHRLINQDSGYQINTSNLTATVRGTVFSISLDNDMNTTIAVIEGTVHAENPTNSDIFIPVTAGNYLTVSATEQITTSATIETTEFEDAPPEYTEIITILDDFYEVRNENLPEEDENPENGSPNGNGNNGGGNGNGNNGNGNGNGGSNGNSNNGNGNTNGNNGGGNGNGNNGNGNGNGGSNGNSNNGNGNTSGNNGGGNGGGNNGNGNGGGNGNGNNGNGNGNGGGNGNGNH